MLNPRDDHDDDKHDDDDYRHLLSSSYARRYTAGHVKAVGQFTSTNHLTHGRQVLRTRWLFSVYFQQTIAMLWSGVWFWPWPSNDQHVTATAGNLHGHVHSCCMTDICYTTVLTDHITGLAHAGPSVRLAVLYRLLTQKLIKVRKNQNWRERLSRQE